MKSNISVHTHERTYYAMNPIAINVKSKGERGEGGGGNFAETSKRM